MVEGDSPDNSIAVEAIFDTSQNCKDTTSSSVIHIGHGTSLRMAAMRSIAAGWKPPHASTSPL